MAKQKSRRRHTAPAVPTPFEQARDELFQHVIRCGVIGASSDDQTEWFNATLNYLADRFPELSKPQVQELRTLGERFAQPPKRQTTEASAVSAHAPAEAEDVEADADASTEDADAVPAA
jgi:hypothetical protein